MGSCATMSADTWNLWPAGLLLLLGLSLLLLGPSLALLLLLLLLVLLAGRSTMLMRMMQLGCWVTCSEGGGRWVRQEGSGCNRCRG